MLIEASIYSLRKAYRGPDRRSRRQDVAESFICKTSAKRMLGNFRSKL